MALKRNETYPGRFSNPTDDHPQGAFKNRSAPGAQDGSYLEQQWANDWDGFFGRLLTLAGVIPNGEADTASSSQYYDALKSLFLQRTDPFADIKSDGAEAVSTALENLGLGASAFGLKNFVVFSTAGVSTWTVPDELKSGRKAKVTVIGAGGSGGRSGGGGGGGGGGKAVKLVDLTGIESVPITVGAGGAKAAAGTTSIPGNSGGSSSFGTFCSATGGSGGGNVSGGSSGIGVNGDINTGTGPGNPGAFYNSGSYVSGSGGGAGGPGSLSSANSEGSDAIGPGGGGSGAATGSTTVSSRPGAGYSGMVLIEW